MGVFARGRKLWITFKDVEGKWRNVTTGYDVGQKVRIYFRPNDVYVTSREESLQVKGKIIKTRFQGPVIELAIDVGAEKPVLAHVPKGLTLASGFAEDEEAEEKPGSDA